MVFLLSLIADDSVCVSVFEGEGREKVVIPARHRKVREREKEGEKEREK